MRLQPFLHDLVSSVRAPSLVLSPPDGQIAGAGVVGWFVDDIRLMDTLTVQVHGTDLELVRSSTPDAHTSDFAYVARALGDDQSDPTVFVDRRRVLGADALTEQIVVSTTAQREVDVALTMRIGGDGSRMSEVKQGGPSAATPAHRGSAGLAWSLGERGFDATATPQPADIDSTDGVFRWRATLHRGERLEIDVRLHASSTEKRPFGYGGEPPWGRAAVVADDPRLDRLVQQSLTDLAGLLLTDTASQQGDQFLAAGSPWFLTLFGRDSLWAARMMLPFGTDLAMSTLRTLARRQGRTDDPSTEEQPGKILHEVRSQQLDLGSLRLPPVYYGSIDATTLWVILLAEARRWGAGEEQVRELLPVLRACLEWIIRESRTSGWLRYVDRTGTGLANQGWKDSDDAVQFADGRLAAPPIALCEVQGYAFQAARGGAALLDDLGAPEVPGLEAWADDLRERFTSAFWCEDEGGRYPAIALDADGRRVDAVASNMGHLLGTGLVQEAQSLAVAERLASAELSSGFGLRTLTARSPRFSRLSYHGGTVWPHDTAIAVHGLAAEGYLTEAGVLTAGLVAAAEGFGYRLPELYGGEAAADVPLPSSYPAACRPQAWSAAAPLACLVALTGLRVDAPRRSITVPSRTVSGLGPMRLDGLRVAGQELSVHVDADGRVDVQAPAGFEVEVRTS